jgi:hypothetical protein
METAKKIALLEDEIEGYRREREGTKDKTERNDLLKAITVRSSVLKGLLDQQAGKLSFILRLQISL